MASWTDRTVTNEHLLPYVDSKSAPEEVAKGFKTLPFERNIFKLLANSPTFFPVFMKMLSTCWSPDRTLRSSDWQLIVLRTAATLDAPYEFDVNEPVARVFGFTDAHIHALKDAQQPLPEELFTKRQLLLARMVEQLNGPQNRVDAEILKAAQGVFGDTGVVEVFYINGVYGFLARFMNSARVDFDEPIAGLDDMLKTYNAAAIEKEKTYRD
ncbi:hypothetical protein Tdes44962_MAKER02108 [Teratosphaeria destructans]|uniref:Carboxymuconolactone decarboxylase-like domain-containing protein n=1 Tax=Teratosphaeria destructans TaxID=418781 RepID=A0A9W7W400_9PEZI|nr:hypothetical protein Tdes44962_MAKER02108 [Teratosphaeria destructans]